MVVKSLCVLVLWTKQSIGRIKGLLKPTMKVRAKAVMRKEGIGFYIAFDSLGHKAMR